MMAPPERLHDLAQTVKALLVERRGAWHAEDFVAVAGLLGFASNWIAPLGPQVDASGGSLLSKIREVGYNADARRR